MDRHLIALIAVVGITLDLLGGLYLAYDLLGGKHGPLRTLTRMVTYGVLFGGGAGLTLGVAFGIAGGITFGVTIGHEFQRASEGKAPMPWKLIFLWCAIRGIGFGIGATFSMGLIFGIWFGVLTGLGQMFAYKIGFTPSAGIDGPMGRLLLGALNRTVGYIIGGLISGLLAMHNTQGLRFGLSVGLTIGILSAVVAALIPSIEWRVDHLPTRMLGAVGAGLVVLGFALQSIQYWVVLLDVPIR